MTKIDLIYQDICSQIDSRSLKVGDRIPTVIELMKSHKCSRMTVITALKHLQADKIIHSIVGSGNYVFPKPRRNLILVLHGGDFESFLNWKNVAFHQFLYGARKACSDKYLEHAVVYDTYESFMKNIDILNVIYPRLQGIILFRSYHYKSIIYEAFSNKDIPLLSYGSMVQEAPVKKHGIYVNEEKLVIKAISYLLKKGHKNIGIISFKDHPIHKILVENLEALFQKAELSFNYHHIYVDDPYGKDINKKLEPLRENGTLDNLSVLFSLNDSISIATLWTLTQWGIRCPEDLSLMSADNSPYIEMTDPGLTCISLNIEQDGEKAVHLLLDTLPNRKSILKRESSISLVERESVKSIN